MGNLEGAEVNEELKKKQRAAITTKYQKNHTRAYTIRCHNDNEQDMIAYLDSQENISKTIKGAIREKMDQW